MESRGGQRWNLRQGGAGTQTASVGLEDTSTVSQENTAVCKQRHELEKQHVFVSLSVLAAAHVASLPPPIPLPSEGPFLLCHYSLGTA